MPSFTVLTNTTDNVRKTLVGAETGTIEANATLTVSNEEQTIRFNGVTNGGTVNNSGIVENTHAEGRAIRFNDDVGATLNATINNIGTASIIRSTGDDAMQIQADDFDNPVVTAGLVTINNAGLITSTAADGAQAVDFANTGGTFVASIVNNTVTSTIRSDLSDAIRFGSVGNIENHGVINGGAADGNTDGADGVQYEDGTVAVPVTGTVTNSNDLGGGSISGDRHGINAGEFTTISVVNNGGSITGRNGSGVGSDGNAMIANTGTITGGFTPGVDINGPGGPGPDGTDDGDGDGVDVDGQATISNHGIIQGIGSNGHGSDGRANTSEGIAAGGGVIVNHAGATIIGAGLGILVDDSSRGNAPFLTTISNSGAITGSNGIGIEIISSLNDTITNNGTITGGGAVPIAIKFGAGNNTLAIQALSTITGFSDGGDGIDTLDYSGFVGSGVVGVLDGPATGASGGILNFETIIGSAQADLLFGNGGANTLSGGGGADNIFGGAGADTINGGADFDFVRYDLAAAGVTLNFTAGGAAGDALGDVIGADVEGVVGSGFDDVIVAAAGDNQMFGLAGNDILFGEGGVDTLFGGAGVDGLWGGAGVDLLVGGADADFFVTEATSVANGVFDFVFDFEDGADTIMLLGWAPASLFMFESGGHVFVTSADAGFNGGLVVLNSTLAQVQDQVLVV